MSTPISRDNKLEGLELYAPRHARVRTMPGDRILPSAPPAQEVEQAHIAESDPLVCGEAEDEACETDDAIQQALEEDLQQTIQDTIREAVDIQKEAIGEPAWHNASPRAYAAKHQRAPPFDFGARRTRRSAALCSPSAAAPSQLGSRRSMVCRRLDPEVVPPPPMSKERSSVFPLMGRFAFVVGVAASVAYGFTMISSIDPNNSWAKRADETIAAIVPMPHQAATVPQVTSHLLVENQRALVNDPLPLDLSVNPSTGHESLVLAGLAAGTRISAGTPVSNSSWRVPSRELAGLYLYAPKDFVGVMDTAVDLLSPNERLLDRREMQLEWIAKKPALPPVIDRADLGAPKAPLVQPIDPEQAAVLMKRGQDALRTGDIVTARLAFGRVADAGNADAALALATTYDAGYLAKQNVIGVVGDEAKARGWYQRAAELGSTEAKNILAADGKEINRVNRRPNRDPSWLAATR